MLGDFLVAMSVKLGRFSETPMMDASILVAGLLKRPRSWVIAHPKNIIGPDEETLLEDALERLDAGEPLPYILGHWEFYGLDFILNPATLIPRPETELLVEQALKWLREHPYHRRVADVGTGSGCIAISLAYHIPDLMVVATDISGQALQAAQANAQQHSVARQISFIQNNLLDGTQGIFDLICANLPYVPTETLQSLSIFNKEPALALDGGQDGLDAIRALLKTAPDRLAEGGRLMLEIEASQASAVFALASKTFVRGEVFVLKDLAGIERLFVKDNIL